MGNKKKIKNKNKTEKKKNTEVKIYWHCPQKDLLTAESTKYILDSWQGSSFQKHLHLKILETPTMLVLD